MLELNFTEGENKGARLKLPSSGEIVIGRSQACDICLTERKISRKHAVILFFEGRYFLEDMGSTNGTYINGERVEGRVELSSGDIVRIGGSVMEVIITPDESEVPAADRDGGAVAELGAAVIPVGADISADEDGTPGAGSEIPLPSASESGDISVEEGKSPKTSSKRPLSGSLSEMALSDLLQTLGQNKRSGHLLLTGPDKGDIILKDGVISGAKCGRVKGKKAFYRMLGWEEADFEFISYPSEDISVEGDEKIDEPAEALLLEGYRQLDEISNLKDKLPGIEEKLVLNTSMPGKLSKLHPRVLDVLQLAITYGTVSEILDRSSLDDLDVWKIIAYLLKKEFLLKQ